VVSADGTSIGYREVGRGPGVVLIHGGMQAAQNLTRLAQHLGPTFTVYVPDRRGRGRSGPFGDGYGLATECADLDAILRKTGARCVFGLSSGALIALHAARTIPGIDRLAVYEPPLTTPDACPTSWVPRYEREMDRGDLAAAMVTAIKGTADVSALAFLPRFVLVPLMRLAIRADRRTPRGETVRIADLVPTVRFDARLAREAEGAFASYASIRSEVLLLGGARSARPLRIALGALATLLPDARRVEMKAIGHLAADNSGRPSEVADLLRAFFAPGATLGSATGPGSRAPR
jgi:pimeloyl-ACP methyl ester carboxylesterase